MAVFPGSVLLPVHISVSKFFYFLLRWSCVFVLQASCTRARRRAQDADVSGSPRPEAGLPDAPSCRPHLQGHSPRRSSICFAPAAVAQAGTCS